MGVKLSVLGAWQAEDSFSFVYCARVHTVHCPWSVVVEERCPEHDAGGIDMRLMVSHGYICTDEQEMKC